MEYTSLINDILQWIMIFGLMYFVRQNLLIGESLARLVRDNRKAINDMVGSTNSVSRYLADHLKEGHGKNDEEF